MTYSHNGNFLADAIAVMILLLMPMALPIIRSIPGFNLSKMSSIGGGMAIGAVFAFLIPDLMGKIHNVAAETNIEFLKQKHHLLFVVFSTFLVAFCTMYALEKVALEKTKNKSEPSTFVFYLHMGILCASLIAFVGLFPALSRVSFYAVGILCSVMVFQIFLEEVSLLKHFGGLYSHVGRYIVMIAIVIGWIIGLKFIDQETTVFTLMAQAFVTGMILTAVIKGEFDMINQANNYIIFIISATINTSIVLTLMLIGDAHEARKAEKPLSSEIKQTEAVQVVVQPTVANNETTVQVGEVIADQPASQ